MNSVEMLGKQVDMIPVFKGKSWTVGMCLLRLRAEGVNADNEEVRGLSSETSQ